MDRSLSIKEFNVNKSEDSKFTVTYFGEINDHLGVMKVKIPKIDVKLNSSKHKQDKGIKLGEVPLNEVSEFISRYTSNTNNK